MRRITGGHLPERFGAVASRRIAGEFSSRASHHRLDLAKAYPDADKGIDLGAVPLQQDIVGDLRAMLIVLWLAVAFMLAVGCANVANLLLTHAAGRQREFAVRRSVGATNLRLARQLLTESLVLASAGGSLGLAIAFWAVPFMAARLPEISHGCTISASIRWLSGSRPEYPCSPGSCSVSRLP